MKHQSLLFAFFLAVLTFFSCKKEFESTVLSAEDIGRFIAARVPAAIEPDDAVRIRFAVPVDTTQSSDIFSFQPATQGSFRWEDDRTLSFSPETGWLPGTSYQMQIDLDKVLIEKDPDIKHIVLDFMVNPVRMTVFFEPLVPEFTGDHPKYFLRGVVNTSVQVESGQLEKIFSAKTKGEMDPVQWTHNSAGTQHELVVANIAPGALLDFSWDGQSVGAKASGSRSIRIPDANTFSVLSFEPGTDGERKINVYFSQKIKATQELNGLVTINDRTTDFTLRKKDHILSIYPDKALSGELAIQLNPAITSSLNKELGTSVRLDVSLDDPNPAVKLVGAGVITPGNTDVVFPFEAINLKRVQVEVLQIFENNILQYLQYNDLEDPWGLEPVGRIILKKEIDLSALSDSDNRYVWTRYALDLGPLVKLSPGSIYQVRVGFQGSDSYLDCYVDAKREPEPTPFGEVASMWSYDYGYPGFNWSHTDDPCYPAYYNPGRFISRNILASDIGLTAKRDGKGKIWVYANSITSAAPKAGVKIEVFDFQQQLLCSGNTTAEGSVSLEAARQPFFVVASYEQQKGYLRLGDGLSLSMSEFNTGGTGYQEGLRGYIYGERDVWRPGDSVFLNFILWDPEGRIDARHPVRLTVTNPLGQKKIETTSPVSMGGIYDLAFTTSPSDPTGNWMAKVQVGDAVFTKGLKIETIKPNRLSIDAELPESVKGYASGQSFELTSKWLYGAPAANLKAVVEAQFKPKEFSPEGFRAFSFSDPARKTPGTVTTIFNKPLDANGQATVSIPQVKDYLPEGCLSMSLKTRVFEAGGDFSTDRHTTTYHPYQHYAGVSIPKNRWGYEEMVINKSNKIQLASVTTEGKGAGGRTLTVGVYHARWRWWWDRSHGDITQYNSALHLGAMFTDTLVTGSNGQVTYELTPQSYGSYMIRVCDTESGHCSGQFYYAGSWGDPSEDSDGASRLTFTADKEQYEVGDEVILKVPSAPGSKLLLTIEKNQSVLSTQWHDAKGDFTEIRFKATAEMMPNVYAYVSHIQPFEHPGNDMPLRMYGVLPIMVADPATMLHPEISVADVLEPDKSFTVTVSEKDNLPMAYTIAVVDEGLLGLTRFESPNPWDHFHRQEALGVQTWDMFDQVLGGYGGVVDRLLSLGGDGAATLADAPQAERFKPVVMHLGPFYLDAGKEKKHTLVMPNYVGAVRTMVVASDRKRWGAADKTSQVKSDLMVQATLPRVVSPGETITVPVQVHAMSDQVRQVDLQLKTNDMATVEGNSSQSIQFSTQGEKMVYFELTIPERPGILEVDVSATSGRYKASQQLQLDVRIPNPAIAKVVSKTIGAGESWTANLELPGMEGTNDASVELSIMPSINLQRRLKYLIRYPYGCLEQTVSSVFPQLYLSQLTELNAAQEREIRSNIQKGIERIRNFNLPSGGFTYWPGERSVDSWSSSYAGHFLIEAAHSGYTVDQSIMSAWRKAQERDAQAYRPGTSGRSDLVQAYRLYTLALDGQPAWGMMNKLRVQKDSDPVASWLLAATYALGNRKDVAEEIIKSLNTQVQPYQELTHTYGSELRDKAIILETFLAMGKMEDALAISTSIAESLSGDHWYSTQSTSFSLTAMGKLASHFSEKEIKATVTQQGKTPVQYATKKALVSQNLDVSARQITIQNQSADPLNVRLVTTGKPLRGVTNEIQNNLKLTVKYVDKSGNPVDVSRLTQGQDFIAKVTVTNPGTYTTQLDEMALTYLFPSGWEIANQRMDNFTGSFKNSSTRYQDIRDDRVHTFFNMGRGDWTYHFVMTATYAGQYWLPDITCEAMYSHKVQARIPGRWVEVVPASPVN